MKPLSKKRNCPGPGARKIRRPPFCGIGFFTRENRWAAYGLKKIPMLRVPNLGICLISAIYMGQGIAGEAISRMLAQGKQVWNVRAVCTRMDGQNLRARRCCESLGFREVNQVQPDGGCAHEDIAGINKTEKPAGLFRPAGFSVSLWQKTIIP